MSSSHLATELPSWSKLQQLYDSKGKALNLRAAFEADPKRFETLSRKWQGSSTDANFLVDFSKNLIDDEILSTLVQLAREAKVEEQRDAMYAGERINTSEDRAVLHVALRDLPQEFGSKAPGVEEVKPELEHLKAFSDAVRSGAHKGYTGKAIKSIVNIGIGGSNLGPLMVTQALKPYSKRDLDAHFVSNIDGTHMSEALRLCDPETTLFIVASKTFTTQETITNATTARDWFLKTARDEAHVSKHFVALSTNTEAVTKFGIDKANMFKFWDWVGGRYSLWSAIGLSISIVIGYENFEQLLLGAHDMDKHFKETKLEDNLPVLLGVLAVWYNNFFGAQSYAQLCYDQYLHRFAAYFQQASMESLGKGVAKNGKPVNYETGEVLWGEAGTDGQHAFYQLIHQGTKVIPCDFIAPIESQNPIGAHHDILLSNFFAQPEALAFGKTEAEVKAELSAQDQGNSFLVQSKIFSGNRPTNSILVQKITPAALGALIALYEHKIAVQGFVWNVNAYDQWGVELGKVLAKKILPALEKGGKAGVEGHDSSTTGLIKHYLANRK